MGTWGPGSFENDTALDCASEINSVADIDRIFAETGNPETLDADQACRIVVAGECVAAMRGHRLEEMPSDLAQRVLGFGNPTLELFDTARNQVSLAMMELSELTMLWAEADSEERAAFNLAMTDLMERLNKSQKQPGKPAKKKPSFNPSPCSFCGEPMGEVEASMFDITVSADDISSMKMGGWAHIKCLNAALHPQYMIQNWDMDDELLEFVMSKIERE